MDPRPDPPSPWRDRGDTGASLKGPEVEAPRVQGLRAPGSRSSLRAAEERGRHGRPQPESPTLRGQTQADGHGPLDARGNHRHPSQPRAPRVTKRGSRPAETRGRRRRVSPRASPSEVDAESSPTPMSSVSLVASDDPRPVGTKNTSCSSLPSFDGAPFLSKTPRVSGGTKNFKGHF